jgi:hypothetical protein
MISTGNAVTIKLSLAQAELQKRKGVKARVVPNIFDFNASPWKKDVYNWDFRAAIGLQEREGFC